MCCPSLCGCLYKSRSCFARLLLPMLLADLALTAYILAELIANVPFACCTDPTINDCSYDDLGGSDNVRVNDNGFCQRKDNSTLNCETRITNCALTEDINMDELCDDSTLDTVATNNWAILLGILSFKTLGLIILIIYDWKHTWCNKDKDRDGADEDAEDAKRCCVCDWTKDCCKSIIFFLFRLSFLVIGTAITFAVLALLRWTGAVSRSVCDVLPNDNDIDDCETIEDECSTNNGENYYVIVWDGADLSGPVYVQVIASVLTSIVWIVRLSVVWYYSDRLAKV